ncbi:tol-pal system protein YbgF [Dyella lipolytica]|uniref:Cell division coordinator CpoB n=1 Tax=Dyella lipolytica TaxID=1867835 RepID=A0ABW8IQK8_9GAMM|nr:tol-pal system protein YbgF [Dyella lipolytica]GLQ47171.1 tol-pal system protein YbgF [Dyella lipolytica]
MTVWLANRFTASISMAGALASALLFVAPAHAQNSPMSLADRVARLEQQSQNQGQNRVDQLSQLQQMQTQMQQMQGQIEELQHQLQQLQDQSKAQYTDADSRLGRLEKGASANPASAASSSGPAPAASAPSNASTKPVASPTPSAPAESAADKAAALTAYNAAFKSLRAGDYVSSSRGFREFIQKYPNDALTSNAFYWLGESYYATTNYPVAVEAFKHLLSQYPQSDKVPDATLKLGYSQLEMKQTDAGIATLKSVPAKYPNSNAAKLAQERLRRLSQQPAH